jgi:hypothetical protein
VEHHSKHLELVPVHNKDRQLQQQHWQLLYLAAMAVQHRYSDRGEWYMEFEQLLLGCMVDHHRTSAAGDAASSLLEAPLLCNKDASFCEEASQ